MALDAQEPGVSPAARKLSQQIMADRMAAEADMYKKRYIPPADPKAAEVAARACALQARRDELADRQAAEVGRKLDGDKPRLDLLLADMPHALEAIAMVLTHGAEKYAPGNWQHVPDAQRRYLAAGARHELELAKGIHHDPETGEHHLAHAACCLLFRLELLLREDF